MSSWSQAEAQREESWGHARRAAGTVPVVLPGKVREVAEAALHEGALGLVTVALYAAVHGLVGGALRGAVQRPEPRRCSGGRRSRGRSTA
eukprot:9701479-Alexandrium_andersonii.AAC.1